MRISDYLREDFCIMDLKSSQKEDAIKEIAACLSSKGPKIKEEEFIAEVLERETLGSTGIGCGVAIPHARTSAVGGFVIGFGRSRQGVDFNALDGEKVKLIFLMGAHPKDLNLYLRLLAELSKLLMDGSFRQSLLSAETGRDIIDAIRKFE